MTKQEIKQILLDNSIEQNGNQVFDSGNLEVCAMELKDNFDKLKKSLSELQEATEDYIAENKEDYAFLEEARQEAKKHLT